MQLHSLRQIRAEKRHEKIIQLHSVLIATVNLVAKHDLDFHRFSKIHRTSVRKNRITRNQFFQLNCSTSTHYKNFFFETSNKQK